MVPPLRFFSFRVDPLLLEHLRYSGLLDKINKTPMSERVSTQFFDLQAVPCEDFCARTVINPTWHEGRNPATAPGHGIPNNTTDCLVRDVSHSTGQRDQIYLPDDLNERVAWVFIFKVFAAALPMHTNALRVANSIIGDINTYHAHAAGTAVMSVEGAVGND